MTSTADVARNLERATELCGRASARGARLVVLPENFALLSTDETDKFRHAVELDAPRPGDIVETMRAVAARLGLHLVLGGLPEKAGKGDAAGSPRPHVYNSCIHVRSDGSIGAVYRKIHLFDVDLGAEKYRESDYIEWGKEAVIAVLSSEGEEGSWERLCAEGARLQGDAALAIFGAPLELDNFAGRALAAARELREGEVRAKQHKHGNSGKEHHQAAVFSQAASITRVRQ